jgi:tetratricopeptide (TPR) repeat protein
MSLGRDGRVARPVMSYLSVDSRRFCEWRFVMLLRTLVVMVALIPSSIAFGAEKLDKSRLVDMLGADDTGLIVQTFRRHPSQTLPFIDAYFEGGLADIEKGGAYEDALKKFRIGVKFAKLADEAFHETVFSEYANSFASWSPTEQKRFREGQRLFREAVKQADKPDEAIPMLRQSLKLAESLGDTWGQAMAQSAIAEIGLKAGRHDEAHLAAVKAIELNARLKLQEDFLQALMVCAEVRQAMGTPDAGVGHLRQAWITTTSDHSIDAKVADQVFEKFTAALDRSGKKDEADKMRKERAAEKAAATTQPAQ